MEMECLTMEKVIALLGLSNIMELPTSRLDGDSAKQMLKSIGDTLPFNPLFRITNYSHDALNFQWNANGAAQIRIIDRLSTTDLTSGQWNVIDEAIPGATNLYVTCS